MTAKNKTSEIYKIKTENYKLKRMLSYAWGQYFQKRNELFELQDEIYEQVNEVGGTEFNPNHNETSNFLMSYIRDLYKKAKENVECPICLEHIEADDLTTTGCGHNFHTNCLEQLKSMTTERYAKCPVCRSNIKAN